MAWTEIHPVKSTLRKALDYICNPEKTDDKLLISSFGCDPETADIEFQYTLNRSVGNKGNNLAHHLIQSFDYGEVSPAEAHQIGQELAAQLLGGKYEYVLTTHIDKGHPHNHLLFCATNFVDHHKYVSNNHTRFGIRAISDRLCREHGLSVINPRHWKTPKAPQAYAGKTGTNWNVTLTKALDHYIPLAQNFDDLLRRMEQDGFTIKRAKYTSYKAPGQSRFMGGVTLGEAYTDERIKERIAGRYQAPVKRKPVSLQPDDRINLILDIENNVKAQQSRGYEQWAKIHNLKQAAKTVAFLTEHQLLKYADLQEKIEEIETLFADTGTELKAVEARLADMALLIKQSDNFRRTYPDYLAYQKARNKETVFEQRESNLLIHMAAKKALKQMGVTGKLPAADTLKQQYAELETQKKDLYQQYGNLKKQVKEYAAVKSNIDQILGHKPEPDKTKEQRSR